MRLLLAALLALGALPPASGLKIVVLAGEDAVNVIQKKTAVAPVVEVRDRNDLGVVPARNESGNIEAILRRTPADLERLTGAPGGAIYGTASMGPRAASTEGFSAGAPRSTRRTISANTALISMRASMAPRQ